MKTIIAGSRGITQLEAVERAVADSGFEIAEVVSGAARGVDTLGEVWAAQRGVPVQRCLADWDRYGRRAGHVRNTRMAMYADALVAVWDGESRGTAHMIEQARTLGLKVHVHLMLNLRGSNQQ